MKWVKLLATILSVLFWTGCSPVNSIYPFFEPNDKVVETKLLGEWSGQNDATIRIHFACQDLAAKECHLHLTAPNDDAGEDGPREICMTFNASLFRVRELLFLDLEPQAQELRWNDRSYTETTGDLGFYLPVHTVYRVRLDADTLRLAYLDDDAVERFVEAQRFSRANLLGPGSLLIAPTRELQNQLLAHAEDDKLLSDDMVFLREDRVLGGPFSGSGGE